MIDKPVEYPRVDLATMDLSRETMRVLPPLVARKIWGLCIHQDGNALLLAVSDPSNVHIFDMVEVMTGGRYKISLAGADPDLLELAGEWGYLLPEAMHDVPWRDWLRKKSLHSQRISLQEAGSSEPSREITGAAVERADQIIKEAIALGASDIHLESYQDSLSIRYRVDGVLELAGVVESRDEAASLVKRLKVMAKIDIAQEHITQGGRISVSVGGRAFDLRVSVVPVATGENIVLRLLSKSAFRGDLGDLGMEPDDLASFREALSYPDGMVLVSGPTGSGKSTSLYAGLRALARPDRKVLTVEDPVEYQMPGITQVQVNTAPRDQAQKVTFASALREFLRQDPDVIMVGEIRDEETARISVQAALTGHLVLSTLHTNDAVGIVNRLRDQGIPPYLIASTLGCGVAQRLARRLCPKCRVPAELTPAERERFARHGLEPGTPFRAGAGCETCRRTGYAGRVGLFQVLMVNDEIRRLIELTAPGPDVAEAARRAGMRSLVHDGLVKASRGLVSLEEMARVTRA